MAIHIETQDENEVMHIRSRELQLENTAKLEQMVPIVEAIDEVNLPVIESNTSEIKDMVQQNLDNQVDLDDIYIKIEKIEKNEIEIKKSLTRLSKKIDKIIGENNE